jgi:hypothetical protein
VTADPPENGPEIVQLPSQRMAALYVKGRPDQVLPAAIAALRRSLYALKFARARQGEPAFSIGRVRVRFPDAHLLPVEQWTTVIGLPVPETTHAVPQQVGGGTVRLETWEYGTVAQIRRGPPAPGGEHPAARLHRFITESGHTIIGVHEEEYLAGENGALTAAVIRYRVRPL